MAGITGKNSLSIKKMDVQESKIPAIGFNKIRFAHKASAGDTSFILTALTTPTEMTANGFVQPNLSVLSQLNLSQFRENFVLRSSLRGVLMDNLAYTLTGASKVNLLFSAEDGEIFEGIFDYVARTGNTLVDAMPLVVTGTLDATETDFNVGTPFEVGKYSDMQVGSVMVFVDNQIMYRNSGNNPPGPGVDGDYYEVHAGGGLGTIIRFNTPDLVNDRGVIVVSVGSLVERPIGSQLALVQAVAGQIDSMIPTLAALAGVPETDFQAAPNDVDLKAFGDRVLQAESDIDTLESTKQNLLETVYIKDVRSSGTGGGTFTAGSWQTRVLNTVENPDSAVWVSLVSNQFTLQPGSYDITASAPGYGVAEHKIRLRNISDSTDAVIGQSQYSNPTNPTSSVSTAIGRVAISAAKVFEIQHQCTASSAQGLGNGNGFGVSEIFAQIKITRLRD